MAATQLNRRPPAKKPTLTLKFEDASCTETWITLTTTNLQLPTSITLKQNNQTKETINLTTTDTLLYIDFLFPNTNYSFQVSSIVNQVSSNELSITTLDTTSHNFSFESYTFGEHSSSVLYDVAIINENSIYAVGEIYMNDTLGQPDPTPYNAVHWDGNEWELKRIKTNACGGVDYPPIKTIFAFSSNDILFAHTDGSISHYNGTEYTNDCSLITQLNGSANKMWGRSKNDFYVVSSNGFVAYYQNGQWSRIESGTDLDIYDIWGDYNDRINEYEIIAVAAKLGVSFEKKILRINNSGGVTSVPTEGIPYSIHGIWFKRKNYFIVGSGMYKKYDINSSANWTAIHQGITN